MIKYTYTLSPCATSGVTLDTTRSADDSHTEGWDYHEDEASQSERNDAICYSWGVTTGLLLALFGVSSYCHHAERRRLREEQQHPHTVVAHPPVNRAVATKLQPHQSQVRGV